MESNNTKRGRFADRRCRTERKENEVDNLNSVYKFNIPRARVHYYRVTGDLEPLDLNRGRRREVLRAPD